MGAVEAVLRGGDMHLFSQLDASSKSSDVSHISVEDYFLNSVFFLAIAFIILAIVSFYRFGLMLYYKHNPKSLEIALYVIVGIEGVLRAIFFLVTPLFPDSRILYIIYGLPTNFQVGAYSLLVLYCAQRVHFARWRQIRRSVYWAFIIANFVLFVINLTAMLIEAFNNFSDRTPTVVNSSLFLTIFLIIAIVFVAYSIAMIRQKERDARFKHENPKPVIALTITIVLCMAIHCIWDAVNLAKNLHVSIPSKDATFQATIFFMFLFWELIPACAVIFFFGRIATGDEPPKDPITITVSDGSIDGLSSSKTGLLESEEKQKLLPQQRRSVDGSSPGSLSNSLKHGCFTPTAVTRGTTQLVGSDGSTPNFQFVTQQLAAIAAGEDKRSNSDYEAPPRSSLEFCSNKGSDEEEDDNDFNND